MLPLKSASWSSLHLPYGINSYRAIQNFKNLTINNISKRTITSNVKEEASNEKEDFQKMLRVVKKLDDDFEERTNAETFRSILFLGAFLFFWTYVYIDNKKQRTGGGIVTDFG